MVNRADLYGHLHSVAKACRLRHAGQPLLGLATGHDTKRFAAMKKAAPTAAPHRNGIVRAVGGALQDRPLITAADSAVHAVELDGDLGVGQLFFTGSYSDSRIVNHLSSA